MSYRVRTDNFEGPFDILLYLVSRKQVDIGAISVAQIADQYLEEISHLALVDLDVASDFLLVASTLLEIKAASLIPKEKDDTEEEIAELAPSEARDILVERLLTYKKYKNAAAMLQSREEAQGRLHSRPFGPPSELTEGLMPDFLAGIPIETLAILAVEAFARQETALLESEHIAAKPIPVEVHVRSLHYRIMNKKSMRFSEMIEKDAPIPIVVVTFLAILELYKRSMIKIDQSEQFGDIQVSYIEGSGELTFDDEEDNGKNNQESDRENIDDKNKTSTIEAEDQEE